MKLKKIFLPILMTSIVASAVASNVAVTTNSISKYTTSLQDTSSSSSTSSGLKNLSTSTGSGQVSIPTSYYVQNDIESIANDNGPILLFDDGKAFGATDWYGNPAWYISLGSSDGYYSGAWFSTSTTSAITFSEAGSKVVDWAYNYNTDNLYVLTDSSYLIIVQSKTGEIISATKLKSNSTDISVNKIQIIDFNSSVYLWSSTEKSPKIYQVDPKTGSVQKTIESGTATSNKYLFALIPLDTNYSIAVTSDSEVKEESNSSVSLSLDLVTDDMNKLITGDASAASSSTNTITIPLSSVQGKDIYSSAFKRSSDYVVLIYNKVYSLSLNKSSINDSSFSEITAAEDSDTSNVINSAYIDSASQVYIKYNGSSTVTSLSVSNTKTSVNLVSSSSNSSVFTDATAKTSQVFPVPVSGSSTLVSNSYTGYVLNSTNFAGTGFKNNSILLTQFTSTSQNPQFTIQNVSSVIPSSVTKSSISKGNSITNLTLDTSNAVLIADDIAGVLYVKVPYIISQPWYSSSSSTKSTGYLIGKVQCLSAQNATTWASQSTFTQLFGSLEPNQINETMLNDKGTQILSIPQSILGLTNNELSINFIITGRDSEKGTITITATIMYVNTYGIKVSYKMPSDQTYNVTKAANDYAFNFAGVTSNQYSQIDKTSTTTEELKTLAEKEVSNQDSTQFLTVDISTITSLATQYAVYAKTLPSFWQVDGIKDFIIKSEKYPSDPVVTVLATDDSLGSIIILVTYNNLSNSTSSKFAIKYTGIATLNSSKVTFAGSDTTSPKNTSGENVFSQTNIKDITKVSGFSDYASKLASDLKPNELSNLYSSLLISYMGFTPTVSIVSSENEDSTNGSASYSNIDLEYGSILLKLDFSEAISTAIKNSAGTGITIPKSYYEKLGLDKNGCIYQRYVGLLPIASTYGITLDSDGTQYNSLIMNNNVNSSFDQTSLLSILNIKGYTSDEVTITNFQWDGETLIFTVHAQSKTYSTVSTTKTFEVSWSSKFASTRERSLIVAVLTSVLGATLVAIGIGLYVSRRNKIRKLLK